MNWISRLLRREEKRKVWAAKTQCGQILRALCEGQTIGGKEACELIGSHNGLRRLNQVRARLRARRIYVASYYEQASPGHKYKMSRLPVGNREAARQLLKA